MAGTLSRGVDDDGARPADARPRAGEEPATAVRRRGPLYGAGRCHGARPGGCVRAAAVPPRLPFGREPAAATTSTSVPRPRPRSSSRSSRRWCWSAWTGPSTPPAVSRQSRAAARHRRDRQRRRHDPHRPPRRRRRRRGRGRLRRRHPVGRHGDGRRPATDIAALLAPATLPEIVVPAVLGSGASRSATRSSPSATRSG